MTTSFLDYFMSFNSHMILIPDSDIDTVYYVLPPNQMDWHFKLTKKDDKEWEVNALKEYDFMVEPPYEYTNYYVWCNDTQRWTHKIIKN